MKIERDRAEVTAGVRHGLTLGGPVALQVANRDYANWEERMNPWPVSEPVAEVHLPRPGHADLVGAQKYNHSDIRNILERASARETAARVAGGALCKAYLAALGVHVRSHVVQIASVHAPAPDAPLTLEDFAEVDASPVRCLIADATPRDGGARSTACARPTSRSAACSRCRPSGSCPAWARTSPGSSASMVAWRWRSARSRRSRACPSATAFMSPACPARRPTTRSSTTSDARLLPRDQPRRRAGGRHDQRPAADRSRRDEAPADAHPSPCAPSTPPPTPPPRRCASAPTPAPSPPPALSARRWSRSCSPTPTRTKFGGDHIDDVIQSLRAYCERIGWRFVLIGFMGAGKSTVAADWPRLLGDTPLDSDAMLQERFGHSVAREFELHGEPAFRAAEEELVCELLDGAGPREVIALGGGSVLSAPYASALAGHLVACCSTSTCTRLGARTSQETAAPSVPWPAIAMRSGRSIASAGGCTRSWPTPSCRRSSGAGVDRRSAGASCLPLRALAAAPDRRSPAVGELALGRLSGARRPGTARRQERPARRLWTWPGDRWPGSVAHARSASPTTTVAGIYGERLSAHGLPARRAPRSRSIPASATRRWRAPNACGASCRTPA